MKDLDWSNLSFGYRQTDYNVRCYYRNGKWGEIEVCSDEYLKLHMAATCLHYGQEAFEGLKAYRCPDGKVREMPSAVKYGSVVLKTNWRLNLLVLRSRPR